MTITVFGANGGIGSSLVKQALETGFNVRAYVRNSSKFGLSHQNLKVIQGDLHEADKIHKAITGADAVISTLGPNGRVYKDYAILAGHKHIIQSMENNGIKRLITIATPTIKFKDDKLALVTKLPYIMAWFLYPSGFKELVQLGKLVAASPLDWTIVRFLMPTNKPQTDRIQASFGDTKINWAISRADIASFVLSQIQDKQYIKSMPIIGTQI